ncbi:MAG: hypothetical protein KHZ15_12785 [Coprobacillus cateniformis]|uniref:hypothetical protein n=1 Tax=Longibaculum muris TaxID=1796628 RepID=UPI003AB66E25|nr:hypothetical protein [Coprobacillus cateniformis]
MRIIFKDYQCLQLLLDIIFQKHLHIISWHTQYDLKNLYGRSLIADIVIEVQRSRDGAHPKRLELHKSLMMANTTYPQDKWADIIIVFICEDDILNEGKPIYYMHTTYDENVKFVDNGVKSIYVNGKIRDETLLGRLMHDFFCTRAEDMYYAVLRERVHYFKNEEGAETMCAIMDAIKEEGIREGKMEGERIAIMKMIRNLSFEEGIPFIEAMMKLHIPLNEQESYMKLLVS